MQSFSEQDASISRTLLVRKDLEEQRFNALRDSLWRCANIMSAQAVAEDNNAEEIRAILEETTFKDCVETFAEEHGTGNRRPDSIVATLLPTSSSEGLRHANNNGMTSESSPKMKSPSVEHLPKKPPRLIHYAKQSKIPQRPNETHRFPLVGKNICFTGLEMFNHQLKIAFPDSVDNIEYFNLSETPPSDSLSDQSLNNFGGDHSISLSDFRWTSSAYNNHETSRLY